MKAVVNRVLINPRPTELNALSARPSSDDDIDLTPLSQFNEKGQDNYILIDLKQEPSKNYM